MTDAEGKVKFAVVGCGHIGRRHIEVILQHPEAELAALCDTLPVEMLNIPAVGVPFFSSLEELLSSNTLTDIICICTPNGYHVEQTIKALEEKNHVLCEKPFGLTKASCEAAVLKAQEVSRQIFCVMQNRYSPAAIWLKELLSTKRLGDIYMVQTSCFWNRDNRYYTAKGWRGTAALDGGPLYTQFSHFIDMLYWLFGDIKNIQARFYDYNHRHSTAFEDSGIISYEFVSGGAGSFHYSTAAWDKNLESSLLILGSKGSVKIGGQYMNEVAYCHIEDYIMPALPEANPANDYGHYKGSAANHRQVFDHVIDQLKGKATATTVNAAEGLKVVELIERIYNLR